MNRIPMRRASAYAVVLVATLALAPSAFAHAELFPRLVPSGDGQLLQLTVPNEKDNASTTEIVMTIPAGFDLESVAPEPGWKATIAGQKATDGEMGGGNSVTWKGKLSGTDLAVLRVHRRAQEQWRLRLRRAPDLLRRQRGPVVRNRGLGHARGPHPGDSRHKLLGRIE